MALGYGRSDRPQFVTIHGTLIGQSEFSYKVRVPSAVNHVWLPISKTDYDGLDTFIIPMWLARKEGLDHLA